MGPPHRASPPRLVRPGLRQNGRTQLLDPRPVAVASLAGSLALGPWQGLAAWQAGSRVLGNLSEGAYPADVMARMRRFVAGSQLHLNQGGLRFDQAGERMQVHAVGWAYGPALADLDNDGWLDLYATSGQISRDRDKPDG